MFERFTASSKKAVREAQEQAAALDLRHVGDGHLLLGLLHEPSNGAAGILGQLGITEELARSRMIELVPGEVPPDAPGTQLPWTPRAKKVLELALREALSLGANMIATEHLLLAIARVPDGVAGRILGDAGVSSQEVRESVMDALGASVPEREVPSVPTVEQLTERAQTVVELAKQEARERRLGHVGTESLLLGLLREQEGIAARVLVGLNVTADRARAAVGERVKGGKPHAPSGPIPFTPRATEVLDQALQEAVDLGHNYVGTEHILLALVSVGEGEAVNVLRGFGADPEGIRRRVMALLAGPGVRQLRTRPRRQGYGRTTASVVEPPTLDTGFRVAPDGAVRGLLMRAGARALDAGRVEITVRELLLALAQDRQTGGALKDLGVEEAALLAAFDRQTAPHEPPAAADD